MREEGRDAAEQRVRGRLLLGAVAEAQQIRAGDAEVEARLDRMAEAQGMKPAELHKLARERDWLEAVRAELVEEKALDFLAAEAKVEETTGT